jgi:hypothetical protein
MVIKTDVKRSFCVGHHIGIHLDALVAFVKIHYTQVALIMYNEQK